MDNFLKNNKIKYTQKGGIELSRSNNSLVDVFFSFDDSKLHLIDSTNLMKLMWYYRDIRGKGKGRRDEFKLILKELISRDINIDLNKIIEYGRFKDVMELLNDSNYAEIHSQLLNVIKNNWDNDLLKKYLPQQNKNLAKVIVKHIYQEVNPSNLKKYRKHKASYQTVERNMSLRENINFETVPSVCMKIHGRNNKAFDREFYGDTFKEYKEKLNKGEVKVNTSAINPVDIYKEYCKGNMNEVLEAQLNQYQFDFDGDVLVVIDTSGSMGGDPEYIAKGLGLFLMRRNKGRFHNLGLIFAKNPQIYKVKDSDTFASCWNKLPQINDAETNISNVFVMMQELAENNANLPKAIVLFSDMQFDRAYSGYTETEYQKWKNILKDNFPQIVFWNCNESINDSYPVSQDEKGTVLLGGHNPKIFHDVMERLNKGKEITPYAFVIDVLSDY